MPAPEKPTAPEAASSSTYFPSVAEILAADDRTFEDVRIPEWDVSGKPPTVLRVVGITGKERDAYEASIIVGRGRDQTVNARNARAKLIVRSVINPQTGEKLFTEEHVKALGDKSALALERLFDVARRLSGLTDTDVKELTENFD